MSHLSFLLQYWWGSLRAAALLNSCTIWIQIICILVPISQKSTLLIMMESFKIFILLLTFTVTHHFNSYQSLRLLILQYLLIICLLLHENICYPDNGGCHTHHQLPQFLHFCCLRFSLCTKLNKYWLEVIPGTRWSNLPTWSRTIAESWKSSRIQIHILLYVNYSPISYCSSLICQEHSCY